MKRKKKNWNEIHLLNIKYQSFKRNNYIIDSIDDSKKLYIIGYNSKRKEDFINIPTFSWDIKHSSKPVEDTIKSIYYHNCISESEHTVYKGWSIFDSLISLRQNLNYDFFDEDNISNEKLILLENNLSNVDKKKIIKWVKRYGLPFIGDKFDNSNATMGLTFNYGFKNDILTCTVNNRCICRLGTFLIGLNIIYRTFGYYLSYLLNTVNNDKFINLEITKSYPQYSYKDSLSYIRRSFNSISCRYISNWDNVIEQKEFPKFEFYAETLISLAMYQLSIIISSNRIYYVSECKLCNNLFIPTRSTRSYCMNCSRQKKYSQKEKD